MLIFWSDLKVFGSGPNQHFCLFVAFLFATVFPALQITKKSVVLSVFDIPSLKELVIIL